MKTLVSIMIFVALVSFATADDVAQEITYVDNFTGVGIRAMAMGGAHIALAQDYSAAYYNPALLGFVYRNEVGGIISVRNGKSSCAIGEMNSRTSQFSSVKLGALGGVLSLQAKRGGVALAGGFYRFQSFDHSAEFFGTRKDNNTIDALENSDGGVGALFFGIGGQVSKAVSMGATVEALAGANNYTWDATISGFTDSTIIDSIFSDALTDDVSGVTGRFGLAITPNKYFTWGALVKFPAAIAIKQEYIQKTTLEKTDSTDEIIEEYQYEDDINLTTPFQFGTGVAFKSPVVNVAADMLYSDWRQTRYHNPAYLVDENTLIPDSYRAVLSFGAGLEFTIPLKILPTRVRAGYRYDPLPYKPITVDKERQAFTGGLALLVDKNFLIECSAVYTNWQKSYSTEMVSDVSESYKITDIHIGMAYRF